MNITEISLRRPITIIMLFVSLAAFGVISARLLPLETLPEIQFPGAFVQIPYQGSSPEEVERLITRPVEEALATMSGIQRMQSTSQRDSAQIGLFFGWDSDAAIKGMEVMDKIDSIRHTLPSDLERVFVFRGSTTDQPIMVLRLSSDQVDLANAYDLLNRNLKRRIERLDGVSQARLEGVEPWELRIEMLPDRLAAYGVSIAEVTRILERANFSVTAGEITEHGRRLRVHPQGEFESVDDVRRLLIRPNLQIDDVAEVTLQSRERNYGRSLDQTYAIGLSVMKETGANMVDVADRVLREIERISELPQMRGIRIYFLDNAADNVRQSLSDLMFAGIAGALLSLLVLYLFLRQIATTLTVTLAVPFSLTITLAAMYFLGITLNILSMMGLMLAVGMLVDNAVVVSENIFRRKLMTPDDPHAATLTGVREVSTAVIAGTLTTIIVFLPIVFGEKVDITVFLEHVAVTIVVSLVASLFISLTVIPMTAARIPTPPVKRGGLLNKVRSGYERFLPWSLHHRLFIFLMAIIVLVAGFAVMASPLVKKDMFPQENQRRLFLRYNIDGIYTLERVQQAVGQIESYLYANKDRFEIDSVYSYFEPGRAESSILLKERDDGATKGVDEIKEAIRENLPQIVIGKPSFEFNQSGNQDGISIQLMGESSDVLFALGEEVQRVLAGVEGLTDIRLDTNGGDREVRITVDRERALANGLSSQQIAQAVAVGMRGQNLREFRGENGEISVMLAFAGREDQTLQDLENLPLITEDGRRITLRSVADFHVTRGPAQIIRLNRATAIALTAGLEKDTTMNDVRPRISKMMESVNLPAGYSWQFGQGFDRADQTQNIMLENMLLAVLLILIVMAALFEAVLQPLGILLSIVFSIAGVFFFFALTGTTFSFMAMIGILILMGVVVNNGIVMVDHINNLRREGLPRYDAIIQGCSDRLRPILMTVSTTVVGLAPLAVSATQVGGDGPSYFPMARAIIGGLLFSTIVTLIILPAVYVLLDDLGRWGKRTWRAARGGIAAEAG